MIGPVHLLLTLGALAACAPPAPEIPAPPVEIGAAECGGTGAGSLGAADGLAGLRGGAALSRRSAECSALGAPIDPLAYLSGHNQGIRAFCATENGRRLGAQAADYADACPADQRQAFLAAAREAPRGRGIAVVPHVGVGVSVGAGGVRPSLGAGVTLWP